MIVCAMVKLALPVAVYVSTATHVPEATWVK